MGTAMKGWLAPVVVCAAICVPTAVLAQENPTPTLELPWGPVTRLASPDGSRILFGVPYQKGVNNGPQLWFEDTRTKQRQMLMSIGGTLSAFWSPDGTAFVVNPSISDQAKAYVYDAVTLARLDLGHEILAADPSWSRLGPGTAHAYFTPERWEGNWQVVVRFHGHTDFAPILCFTSLYRVNRAGTVEKLSENVVHSGPANPCRE